MKTNFFKQPLTFDILNQIAKGFPQYANILRLKLTSDEFMGGPPIPYGTFSATLTDNDAIVAAQSFNRFILIEDSDLRLVPSKDYSKISRDMKKEYFVTVVHITGEYKDYFSVRDLSDGNITTKISDLTIINPWVQSIAVLQYKSPQTRFAFSEKPFNLVLLIPYKNNTRENTVKVLVGQAQDGSVFIEYRRNESNTSWSEDVNLFEKRDY